MIRDDPVRFERMLELVRSASDLPEHERAPFIAAQCGDDPELAREVVELLRRHSAEARDEDPGTFLERARNAVQAEAEGPEVIGPYRVLERIGEGGMGTVYLAEQKEPVRRRVALKVIKLGMDTEQVLRRFEAERQALSLMEHECIARVLDAGKTAAGRPYFAMEYVKGIPITSYCDNNKLSIRERLELFVKVCAGVQHAHQKGVIHRDLKPTNILVAATEQPTPKIIDFGLARATDHRLLQATLYTELGQVIGTPEYMSPEQAGLDNLDIDTRSDVYSLGVVLYELLVGTQPFSGAELHRAGLLEIQRVIREHEPTRPSSKLTTLGADTNEVAARRRIDVRALVRRLRGDLDWIVLKAIEKDRIRRYTTADALADDVRRFLANEPVLATPPTWRYRLLKVYERYKAQVVAGGLLAAALLVGTVGTSYFYVRAERERAKVEGLNSELSSALADLRVVLADEELLALGAQLDSLQEAYEEMGAPWPERLESDQAWLDEAEAVARRRRDVAEGIARRRAAGEKGLVLDRMVLALFEGIAGRIDRLAEDPIPDVRERIEWARNVDRTSISAHESEWAEASTYAARSDAYAGMELVPQRGLVPLGADPGSGLLEFYHLRTAAPPRAIPRRGSDGRLALSPEHGLVFVLIPAGRARLGDRAFPGDLSGDVWLDPFFISKFEATQAQWARLSGHNPSHRKTSDLHPVEQVVWLDADRVLRRCALQLPTEAQWEYAARGGTATPWWTGAVPASLQGCENLAGREAKAGYHREEVLEDRFPETAPVGSMAPNPFGLFDMLGNVREWCLDWFATSASVELCPGDGLALVPERQRRQRPVRGGAFMGGARESRAASRFALDAATPSAQFGVRPARAVLSRER